MKLAVIIVHYHTPGLLEGATAALQRDADASGIELEGVIVDNGSHEGDQALLRSLSFRHIPAPENLGYAGGANLGMHCTEASLAIVMNPDVEVLPGCLQALTLELESGAAVCGPRFYWDAERRFRLPPTEAVGRFDELLRAFAEGSDPTGLWCRWARRRWRRHVHRCLDATQPLESYDLSGALLALRRDAWQRIGPFDEGFALYFEETEWLQRLRRSGRASRYVPLAEAVHLYAQSTVSEGRSQAWFEASQGKFRRQVYGALWTRLVEAAARRQKRRGKHSGQGAENELPSQVGPPSRLEVAASPLGFPAAQAVVVDDPSWDAVREGRFAEAIPEEIRSRMTPGTYFLRTVDVQGRESEVQSWVVE